MASAQEPAANTQLPTYEVSGTPQSPSLPETQTQPPRQPDEAWQPVDLPDEVTEEALDVLIEREARANAVRQKRALLEFLRANPECGKEDFIHKAARPQSGSSTRATLRIDPSDLAAIAKAVAPLPQEPRPTYMTNIKYYKGGKWSDLQGFLRDLQARFDANEGCYTQDKQKILLGSTFLAGDPKDQWYAQHPNGFDGVTYAEFENFIKGTAGDDTTRAAEAGSLTQSLKQQKESFIPYYERWNTVWAQWPVPIPDLARIHLFLPTLRPNVNAQLHSLGLPATWQGLRDVGIRAEKQEALLSGQGSTQPLKPSQEENNTRTQKNPAPRSDNEALKPRENLPRTYTCYHCNEEGHIATYCPRRSGNAANKQQKDGGARPAHLSAANAVGVSRQS
jgi:hypothetical protein